jgi:hypothetical protein
MLSVINGSLLTNPYELGLEWLAEDDAGEGGARNADIRVPVLLVDIRTAAQRMVHEQIPGALLV